MVLEYQDRQQDGYGGKQQHQQERCQQGEPTGSVLAARPGKWPHPPRSRADVLPPVHLEIWSCWGAELGSVHEIDGGQHSLCFSHSSRGTGEGQGHPRGEGAVRSDDRVIIFISETHRHTTFVLALTTAGHDGVYVHGVDLT